MSEFIGSRISLISKSDIRYVGTLVEINSENSTVALENVMSYGTEDRRSGAESFPPSSSLYDYILFRGSDVKDLRIEEPPKDAAPNRPQMPNDPAILGSARPDKSTPSQQPSQPLTTGPPQPPDQQGPHGAPNFPPHPSQFNQFGPYPGMPPQGFGRGFPGGPPPGPGFPGYPGMQFGQGPPPPGWYGPPNQGFAPPQFGSAPPQGPPGAAGNGNVQLPNRDQRPVEKDTDAKTPEPMPANNKTVNRNKDSVAPIPPVESKPDIAAALAPPHAAKSSAKGRVQPAIPLPGQRGAANGAGSDPAAGQSAMGNMSQSTAQQAAAAVAAAMARLPNPGATAPVAPRQNNGVDDLTRKLNDMRTRDGTRGGRGSRGSVRGRGRGAYHKVEIPTTDFDFETANKKFNKEDVAKEAQIGSPDPNQQYNSGTETPEPAASGTLAAAVSDDVVIPPAAYNKSSSFFDNISSQLKDREEQNSFGGSEFRHQERRKNMETFGQGSIDGGYRGGFRGRGRGRGRGGQSRGMGSGGYGRGRGAPRETAA